MSDLRIPGVRPGIAVVPRAPTRTAGSLWRRIAAAGAVACLLVACGKQPEAEAPPRPVRLMKLQPAGADSAVTYSGNVQARIESRLGFRVGGKVAARLVDVGATVKKGQVLARLDLADLKLAESGSRAQLEAARTERDLAHSDLKRFDDLYAKGFISAAEQQRRKATYDAAEARYRQAQAGLSSQSNQLAYGELLADAEGVVTAIEAEVGQVVSPGQPVVRVAQTAEKEVVIALPEDQVGQVRVGAAATVRLWADEARTLPGRVREIAPAADAATRTYTVRVALPNPPAELRLGMTATVMLARDAAAQALSVPLSALLQVNGHSQVWIYDPASQSVSPVTVTLGDPVDNRVTVTQGLQPGKLIVTAGVHLLKPGQKVRVMGDEAGNGHQAASTPATAPNRTAPAR
ncbi:efflux RND transporter periplasmic adaptor subunit [Imbroritus primus]|uniref:Efflux RND transporter periplasmic adaptor subunit n=1 Tax=Imbroritus primus TaxID=3058603 RepID=A0ACD3SR25_9BURK|nr:efflux RND transporter periplasmic adaptor subunit [Burkholderiaceae bacterium PBA]